jgi:hypothetical protein
MWNGKEGGEARGRCREAENDKRGALLVAVGDYSRYDGSDHGYDVDRDCQELLSHRALV